MHLFPSLFPFYISFLHSFSICKSRYTSLPPASLFMSFLSIVFNVQVNPPSLFLFIISISQSLFLLIFSMFPSSFFIYISLPLYLLYLNGTSRFLFIFSFIRYISIPLYLLYLYGTSLFLFIFSIYTVHLSSSLSTVNIHLSSPLSCLYLHLSSSFMSPSLILLSFSSVYIPLCILVSLPFLCLRCSYSYLYLPCLFLFVSSSLLLFMSLSPLLLSLSSVFMPLCIPVSLSSLHSLTHPYPSRRYMSPTGPTSPAQAKERPCLLCM